MTDYPVITMEDNKEVIKEWFKLYMMEGKAISIQEILQKTPQAYGSRKRGTSSVSAKVTLARKASKVRSTSSKSTPAIDLTPPLVKKRKIRMSVIPTKEEEEIEPVQPVLGTIMEEAIVEDEVPLIRRARREP
jgi:DNA-binding phage protein